MSLVMGTAGHIDHGKTSLVRAITGIDCDRLEEEKRRGITIELGFASYPLANGEYLGIVDVPGHERFVKNMVAGASGIDFVMLVIAADEGVMPQTREHLEICSLLGIRRGLVALTKIDMVDADWLALAEDDIHSFLKGTFLEDAPLFPVSTLSGEGLDAVRDYIVQQTDQPVQRSDLARLPVDRVFTLKGHGTVVTGTLVSGSLKLGDALEIVPKGIESRVRSLQNHGKNADQAHAGMRTAVNIHAVDVNDIERGDVLAHPNTLFPAERWLLRLQCLPSAPRPLRNRTELHFHHGAREVSARVRFFDRDRLMPGESCLCEVRFASALAGVADDCCVMRAYSPLRTVAGGQIVWPLPLRLRKRDPAYAQTLELLPGLPELSPEERVRVCLQLCGEQGASFAMLAVLTNCPSRQLDKILNLLSSQNQLYCYEKEQRLYLSVEALTAAMEHCLEHARRVHQREPMKLSMSRGTLLGTLGSDARRAHFILERCLKSGSLVTEGDGVRLAAHRVSLAANTQSLKDALLTAHEQAGMQAPNLKDVLESLSVTPKEAAPVLKMLQDEKLLVKVKDGLYFHHAPIDALLEQLSDWFAQHDTLDPAGLKELTNGLSRKYIIPLLEYFDRERITIRVGDKRQLRGK